MNRNWPIFFLAIACGMISSSAFAPPMGRAPPHIEFRAPQFEPGRPKGGLDGRDLGLEKNSGTKNDGIELFRKFVKDTEVREKKWRELASLVKDPTRDSSKIKLALDEYAKLSGEIINISKLTSLLKISSSNFEERPILYSNYFSVKVPSDSSLTPISDYIIDFHLRPALDKSIEADQILLASFTSSSEGKELIRRDVPLAWQARGGFFEKMLKGEAEDVDGNYFRAISGKTVIFNGHIETIDGHASIEIQGPSGYKYIRLDLIEKASQVMKFNYAILGCETAEFAVVGARTKINDVDTIKSFIDMKTTERGVISFGTMLSKLSNKNLKISIDLRKLDNDKLVPFELRDIDDAVYKSDGRLALGRADMGGRDQSANTFAQSTSTQCRETESVFANTMNFKYVASSVLHFWETWKWYGLLISIIFPFVESLLRRALPSDILFESASRIALATLVIGSIEVVICSQFSLYSIPISQAGIYSLSGPAFCFIIVASVACLTYVNITKNYPDFYLSGYVICFASILLLIPLVLYSYLLYSVQNCQILYSVPLN